MDARGQALSRAGVLTAAALSCACSVGSAGRANETVRSLAEFRHAGVVMQEWDLSCGAAAIATLLTHDLGDPVSERFAAEAMLRRNDPLKVRFQGGFSLLDLQEFAEARGYEANGYAELSIDDVAAMAPAIVPVSVHGFDHFVVLRGRRGRDVVLADPAFGRRSMRISDFERAWERKIAFVVEGRLPDGRALSQDAEQVAEAPAREERRSPRSADEPQEAITGDESTRALERALVRQGAIVLPPLAAEVEAEAWYVYRESGGRRRDTVTPALNLRLGLPWGTQADVHVPYVAFDRAPGVGRSSGFGDVTLGMTKLLVQERRALPELLVTGRWRTTSGGSSGPLATGSGSDGFQGLLTALKRKPPVVLTGSLYYALNLASGGVDRGDAAGLALASLLAATPDVSLLLGIDVATFSATTIRGQSVPATDRLSGIVNIGVAGVLSRRVGANVTAGLGVTPAAPAFQLTLGLPVRL